MIGHVLKMLWQGRRKYAGVLMEQMLIFIILMVSMAALFEAINKYREPGLLNTDNAMIFGYMLHGGGNGSLDDMRELGRGIDIVIEKLRKESFVEAITKSNGLAPYLRSDVYYDEMFADTVKVDGKSVGVIVKFADKEAERVFHPELEEGGWITDNVLEDGSRPAVVSRQLMDKLGWTEAMGKRLFMRGHTLIVVGISPGVKQNVFSDMPTTIIIPRDEEQLSAYEECCAKIKPGYEDEFHACFSKEYKRLGLAEKAVSFCYEMSGLKRGSMFEVVSGVAMRAIPTAFLLLFAFIGTFGLFWLNSKKRKVEFALRLVVGATKPRLINLVVMESLILSVLAALPGMVLFGFVYDWTGVNVAAIGMTLIVMVLFAVFSAWWPAYKVAQVNPVEAMREV